MTVIKSIFDCLNVAFWGVAGVGQNVSNSVNEAFVRLFEKDLIYRAVRPISWCCSLKSAISDAEVSAAN